MSKYKQTTSTPAIPQVNEMITASNIQSSLAHIERAFKSSETRTPLIVTARDGNPAPSIDFLARQQNSRVWSITIDGPGSEQNFLDYVEVGLNLGDWVLLVGAERCSFDTMRKVGTLLMTLQPDPKAAPRREWFRLWLQVSDDIKVNEHVKPLFPQVIMQHAIVARIRDSSSSSAATSPEKAPADGTSPVRSIAVAGGAPNHSPTKLMRRMAAEPPLLKHDIDKHVHRREQGRESDSESDAEEAEKKVTGLWFHRNVEFFANDKEASVEDFKKTIFDYVDKQDVARIKEISESGCINIDKVKRGDMNPLMYAVSRQRADSVKALIEIGADVTLRRESDGSPLLFMAIEDPVILEYLIEGGVDMKTKYEGFVIEDHPLTSPPIAKLIKEMRRSGKFN